MFDSRVIMIFTNQTINSSGTATSDVIQVGPSRYSAVQYEYAHTSTGAYISGSMNILMSANQNIASFEKPQDADGTDLSYIGAISSTSGYVSFQAPMGKYMQVQLKSATNTTIIIGGVWLVLDDNN